MNDLQQMLRRRTETHPGTRAVDKRAAHALVASFVAGATLVHQVGWTAPGASDPKSPSAEEIAKHAIDAIIFSADNSRATIDMDVLKDGKVIRKRRLTALVRREPERIRSMVTFEAPADVAGTKFLALQENGETKQFIYLPAFKRIKRVVGAQRTESFMGTDYSYADLEGRDVKDWTWTMLPSESIDGRDVWVLEARPKKSMTDDAAYGRMRIWVDKANSMPLRSEFYDVGTNELSKRLVAQKFTKQDDRWVTVDSVMSTPKKGTETRLKITALDVKTPIPDEALTKEALER